MQMRLVTLHYLIDAQDGINVQGGKSPNFNKRKAAGWNECTGCKNTV